MSLIGSVPGQKKKNKDLTIGKFVKKLLKKGDKGSKMSRLGDLPGKEKNTPYTETAKKTNKKIGRSVKKKTTNKTKTYTKAQLLAKKRIGSGTAKNPNKTIAQVNAANREKMKEAARKRNEAYKLKRKLKAKKK